MKLLSFGVCGLILSLSTLASAKEKIYSFSGTELVSAVYSASDRKVVLTKWAGRIDEWRRIDGGYVCDGGRYGCTGTVQSDQIALVINDTFRWDPRKEDNQDGKIHVFSKWDKDTVTDAWLERQLGETDIERLNRPKSAFQNAIYLQDLREFIEQVRTEEIIERKDKCFTRIMLLRANPETKVASALWFDLAPAKCR